MVQWDMRALRWNSEFAWTVPPALWYNRIGRTVGWGGGGGADGTVDSHGQSHCLMVQWMGGQWNMRALIWDNGLTWTVPPVSWYSGISLDFGI